MGKKLFSVFTEDMNHCIYTGRTPVERHHIFGGPCRDASEQYGFVVPLLPELHPNGVHAGADAGLIDIVLKQRAQKYFERHYGSREDFIKVFIRSYL